MNLLKIWITQLQFTQCGEAPRKLNVLDEAVMRAIVHQDEYESDSDDTSGTSLAMV